jgi:hypothetical protein
MVTAIDLAHENSKGTRAALPEGYSANNIMLSPDPAHNIPFIISNAPPHMTAQVLIDALGRHRIIVIDDVDVRDYGVAGIQFKVNVARRSADVAAKLLLGDTPFMFGDHPLHAHLAPTPHVRAFEVGLSLGAPQQRSPWGEGPACQFLLTRNVAGHMGVTMGAYANNIVSQCRQQGIPVVAVRTPPKAKMETAAMGAPPADKACPFYAPSATLILQLAIPAPPPGSLAPFSLCFLGCEIQGLSFRHLTDGSSTETNRPAHGRRGKGGNAHPNTHINTHKGARGPNQPAHSTHPPGSYASAAAGAAQGDLALVRQGDVEHIITRHVHDQIQGAVTSLRHQLLIELETQRERVVHEAYEQVYDHVIHEVNDVIDSRVQQQVNNKTDTHYADLLALIDKQHEKHRLEMRQQQQANHQEMKDLIRQLGSAGATPPSSSPHSNITPP